MPIIIILSVVGSYSINNSITDIYWMLGFGILGYFLKNFEFPVGPIVLGIILSPLLERNFRRAILSSQGNLITFFKSLVTNPISLIIVIVLVVMALGQSKGFKKVLTKVRGS
jgi:putative tricarboxylic transport membrane protein